MNNFKIVFLGNEQTGVAHRLLNTEIIPRYVPTLGVEVHPCEADGRVLNVWDCAGQEKFGGLRDGYYICADAAVVFHDINFAGKTKNLTYPQSVPRWVRDFRRVNGTSPLFTLWQGRIFSRTNNVRRSLRRIPTLSLCRERREKALTR